MINYKKYSLTIKTGGNGGKWSVTVRNVWAIAPHFFIRFNHTSEGIHFRIYAFTLWGYSK